MARTAAEESGLSVIYDGRKPSEILSEHPANHAILVHRAKTPASAQRFGSLIHAHCHGRGLILIDPGTCQILTWNPVDTTLCSWLSSKTGYPLLPGEQHQKTPPYTRIIAGCLPGEPVFVNGIIIGYATAEKVEISMQDGTIHARSGIELKHHGIEKLLRFGCPDLANAWCKSGTIRTTRPKKRERSVRKGRIAVIDHTAIACYTICDPHTCGIVTIGDDTTSICGHIGCTRGIPILGITDGDLDGIIADGYAPGSIVLRTVSERDDDLGIEIMRMIPDGDVVWNEWVETIIAYLGERVRIIHREPDSSVIIGQILLPPPHNLTAQRPKINQI